MDATVKEGMTFHYAIGDSSPEWVVVKHVKEGWDCQSEDTHKIFQDKDILQLADYKKYFEKTSNDFYESLETGSTVHVDYGNGKFVRCEVIRLYRNPSGPLEVIHNILKPFAMVGKWSKEELPHRLENGKVVFPSQASFDKMICPNATCIYEHPEHIRAEVDPDTLEELDLTCPPMTEEEREVAMVIQAVEDISDVMKDQTKSYIRRLVIARNILDNIGIRGINEGD